MIIMSVAHLLLLAPLDKTMQKHPRLYAAAMLPALILFASTFLIRPAWASDETPLAVTIVPPHLTNDKAGTLPGNARVTQHGTASYSMEIVVPPGTAGMQPALSLEYNSAASNGLLGLGWSLSGLGRIHRCGKSIAQDGVNGRISFNAEDRLCMDGQRLVLQNLPLNDENYWSGNAIYRTEIDRFSRIKSQIIDGRRSFLVEAKDGRLMRFGSTHDSEVHAIVGTVNSGTSAAQPGTKSGAQAWSVDSVTDRKGNFIKYSYEQDAVTGEHRPTVIRYGGAGLAPHAVVQFVYQARPDAWTKYIDESRNDLRSRIANIKTFVGDSLGGDLAGATAVRDYRLEYENSPTSGRSLLASVQGCAREAKTDTMACLPKTRFQWGKPDPAKSAGFVSRGTWSNAPILTTWKGQTARHHAEFFAFDDFDNNGYADVLEKRVAAGEPATAELGTVEELSNPIANGTRQTAYRFFHNNGQNGFNQYTYQIDTGEAFVVLSSADFNGDGAPDLLVSTPAAARICLSPLGKPAAIANPIVFTCDPNRPAVGANTTMLSPFVVDVLGDGRAAHISRIDRAGKAMLCIQDQCIADSEPPEEVLPSLERRDVQELKAVGFEQMMDFSGVGKPYHTQWSRTHFTKYQYDADGTRMPSTHPWSNLAPTVLMTGFGLPGTDRRVMLRYSYPAFPAPVCETCPPYHFDDPSQGGSLGGDFNAGGYSGLVFGYLVSGYGGAAGTKRYDRAETTLCLSTGRALDCNVRRKYSSANYVAPRAVGNFVGDGHPAILAASMHFEHGLPTRPNGLLQMCRVTGDDTTGGHGTDDANMHCVPWAGVNLANVDRSDNSEGSGDKVYLMDLLGTGRPQMVYYHSGKFDAGRVWQEDGRWEVFEPIDVAANGQDLDRLFRVINGLDAVATFEYADSLPNNFVQRTAGHAVQYPMRATTQPGKLVRKLRLSNGIAEDRTFDYIYQDAAIDLSGRGLLGFATVISKDQQTGITTTTSYAQGWPYTGMAKAVRVTTDDGRLLSRTQNRHGIAPIHGAGTVLPVTESSTAERWDLDGSALGHETTASKYTDSWGNVNELTVTSVALKQTFVSSTVTTYHNEDATWLSGLPLTVTTGRETPKSGSLQRRTHFEYDGYGLLAEQTVEKGNQQFEVVTRFDRSGNPFGLVNTKTESWFDSASASVKQRTAITHYDARGRFIERRINALGHEETLASDPGSGVRTRTQDPNKLVTTWEHDGFGELHRQVDPDGNETRAYTKRCKDDCPSGATSIRVMERVNGSARIQVPHVVYSDSAGHALRTMSWGFDGKAIITDQRYDGLGRLHETYHPRLDDAPAVLASRLLYDSFDRLEATITLDEAGGIHETTTAYQGLRRVLRNARKHSRVEERNSIGQLMQVTDANGGVTRYEYEPFGNLRKTTDPNGNEIVVAYDLYGRRNALFDPNLGTVNYAVDPLGRVWAQSTAEQRRAGHATTMVYDALDRMIERNQSDLKSRWTYDTASNGVGRLAKAETLAGDTSDYQRLHEYDRFGRPALTTQLLSDAIYTGLDQYDAWGRLIRQTYKRGNDGTAKVFDMRYSRTGYLERIERGDLVLWQLLRQDAALRQTKVLLGNGLTQSRIYNGLSGRLEGGDLSTGDKQLRVQDGYQYDALGSVITRLQYWGGDRLSGELHIRCAEPA